MRKALDTIWAKLEGTPLDPENSWKRIRVPGLSTPVYLAVSLHTGLEGLILEIPTSALPAGGRLPASVGFELIPEQMSPGRSGNTRLILALSSDGFRDVFRALALDVATALSGERAVSTAAATFISRVRRWQRFLEVHGPSGLSDSARRGLFSELLIVRELLDGVADPQQVLDGWRGPARESQDFVLPGGNIEVKSTARQSTERIEIANLDQLDEAGAAGLYMVHKVLAETDNGGQTLPALVELVRARAGEALDLLREKLHLAGYLDEHADRYQLPRYQVLGSDCYRVVEGFPRLTSEVVPDGVLAARYSVSLSALEPYRVTDFDFRSLLLS